LSRAFSAAVQEGWIINLTDAHIGAVNLNYQNYRISKLLLAELTRQMAMLWAPRIRVNAIAPGAILAAEAGEESSFEQLARQIPAGRTGKIQDIQQAFAYLVGQDYVTGQTLYVDGGWHCAQ
jgi:NAD(P)-dependent dehydrogenase (short-subunit alcohol dehydrogenase family)